jgi:hypothetical protein
MAMRSNTLWDGTDSAWSNWSGADPVMPDEAATTPQPVGVPSNGGETSPTSGDDGSAGASSGASAPAATWVLPTPLPSGLPSDTAAGSGSDVSPPAVSNAAPGTAHPTWCCRRRSRRLHPATAWPAAET